MEKQLGKFISLVIAALFVIIIISTINVVNYTPNYVYDYAYYEEDECLANGLEWEIYNACSYPETYVGNYSVYPMDFTTKQTCEDHDFEWGEGQGFCNYTYNYSDSQNGAGLAIATALIIAILGIIVAIKLIKNEVIKNGIMIGGVIILVWEMVSASLISPIITLVSTIVLLIILSYIADKKKLKW